MALKLAYGTINLSDEDGNFISDHRVYTNHTGYTVKIIYWQLQNQSDSEKPIIVNLFLELEKERIPILPKNTEMKISELIYTTGGQEHILSPDDSIVITCSDSNVLTYLFDGEVIG